MHPFNETIFTIDLIEIVFVDSKLINLVLIAFNNFFHLFITATTINFLLIVNRKQTGKQISQWWNFRLQKKHLISYFLAMIWFINHRSQLFIYSACEFTWKISSLKRISLQNKHCQISLSKIDTTFVLSWAVFLQTKINWASVKRKKNMKKVKNVTQQ